MVDNAGRSHLRENGQASCTPIVKQFALNTAAVIDSGKRCFPVGSGSMYINLVPFRMLVMRFVSSWRIFSYRILLNLTSNLPSNSCTAESATERGRPHILNLRVF